MDPTNQAEMNRVASFGLVDTYIRRTIAQPVMGFPGVKRNPGYFTFSPITDLPGNIGSLTQKTQTVTKYRVAVLLLCTRIGANTIGRAEDGIVIAERGKKHDQE